MKSLYLSQVQQVCGGASAAPATLRQRRDAIERGGVRSAPGILVTDPVTIEGPDLSGPGLYSGLPLTSCPLAQAM